MLKLSNLFLISCLFLTVPLFFTAGVDTLKIYLCLNCLISFAFTEYITSYFSHIFLSSRSRNMWISIACSICTCLILGICYDLMKSLGWTMTFPNFSVLFAFASATWFGLYCYLHYISLYISGAIRQLSLSETMILSFGYLIVGTILLQVYSLIYNILAEEYPLLTTIFAVLIILVYGVFTLTRLHTKNITDN